MKLLVKNGMIATESQVFQGDILIEDEKIKSIGTVLEEEDAEVIDATGRYVIPGGVDVHTHMDLQSGKYRAVDDFYDGTVAAACGGTTTIVDHMAFGPKGCTCGIRWKNIIVWQMGNQSLIMDFMGDPACQCIHTGGDERDCRK